MRYFSEKVKNGEFDTLTDEEKAERIQLIERHYGKYNKEKDEARIAELAEIAHGNNVEKMENDVPLVEE